MPGAYAVAEPVPEVRAYQEQSKKKDVKGKAVIPAAHVQAVVPDAPQAMTSYNNQHLFIDPTNPTLRRGPMMMRECPSCRQESRTRIKTAPAWQTFLASGILCLAFWPVSFAPLVVDNCKKTEHFCVLCGAKVANIEPFQDCCVTTQS